MYRSNRTIPYSKSFFSLLIMMLMLPAWASQAAEPAAASEPVQTSESDMFVSERKCKSCHKEEYADMGTNIHSKMAYWNEETQVCQTCHGPGKAHTKDKNNPDKILNPLKLGSELANEQCLSCHDNAESQQHWSGSAHEAMDVSCVSCHSVHDNDGHQAMLIEESISETCYSCHIEQRAFTLKRSAHPIRDASRMDGLGKMECTDCHNPHGTQAENLISANSVNDKCYECHQEMKAPVLWEHSAVKESCLNCHNPHGSNHEMMLTAKQPRLCQQCHEQGRHQTIAGETGGFFVTNRGCSNCHAQIHGSNHPGGVKIKR